MEHNSKQEKDNLKLDGYNPVFGSFEILENIRNTKQRN